MIHRMRYLEAAFVGGLEYRRRRREGGRDRVRDGGTTSAVVSEG